MKIDKILYDGLEKGDQISIAETRKIADLLEKNELFEEGIIHLKSKYKIPSNGYSIEKDAGTEEWLFENKGLSLDDFFDECESITAKLGLPPYWYSTIAYFAMFNVFFTPERIPVETKIIQDNGEKKLHIIILERLSKNELKKLIDDLWNNIEAEMNLLPKAKKHKMLRAKIAKEIVRLRDDKKKSYKVIAQTLGEKYADNELFDVLNEDYVKILYHRWKKIVSFKK